MLTRIFSLVCVATVAILAIGQSADGAIVWDLNDPNAASVPISEVQQEGGILVGDKLFENFSVITTGSVEGTSELPDAGSIEVRGLETVEGWYGLQFNGGWATSTGELINSTITFSVTAGEGWLITDNHLWMGAFGAKNDGLVQIAETVWDRDPASTPSAVLLGDKFVTFREDDPENRTADVAVFDPIKTIWIKKDITVRDGENTIETGAAHLSEFYQAFSQIPEPSSLAIAGAGVLLIITRRRKQA